MKRPSFNRMGDDSIVYCLPLVRCSLAELNYLHYAGLMEACWVSKSDGFLCSLLDERSKFKVQCIKTKREECTRTTYIMTNVFFKWAIPGHFFFIFRLFNTQLIVYNNCSILINFCR